MHTKPVTQASLSSYTSQMENSPIQLEQIAQALQKGAYTPNKTLWPTLDNALKIPTQLPLVVTILHTLLKNENAQVPLPTVLDCLEKIAEYPLTDPAIDDLMAFAGEVSLTHFLQNHPNSIESAARIKKIYKNLITHSTYRCKDGALLDLKYQAESLSKAFASNENVSSLWNEAAKAFLKTTPPENLSTKQKNELYKIQHVFAFNLLENERILRKSGKILADDSVFSLAIEKMITATKDKNHFIIGLKCLELIQPHHELNKKFLTVLQRALKEFKNNAGITKRIFRVLLKQNVIDVKELVTLNSKQIDHSSQVALKALSKSVNKQEHPKIKLPEVLLQLYEKLGLKEPPPHLKKLGTYILENQISDDTRWLFANPSLQVKVMEDSAKEKIESQTEQDKVSTPLAPEIELENKIRSLDEVKMTKREVSFDYCLKKLQELEKKGLSNRTRNTLLCLLMEKSIECNLNREGEIWRKIAEKPDTFSAEKLFGILHQKPFSTSFLQALLKPFPKELINQEKLLFLFIENKKNHQDLLSEKWQEIYFSHLTQASYKKLEDSKLLLWCLQNPKNLLALSLLLPFIGEKMATQEALVHECVKKYLSSQKKTPAADLLSNLNGLFLVLNQKQEYQALLEKTFKQIVAVTPIYTFYESDLLAILTSAPVTELKWRILVEFLKKFATLDRNVLSSTHEMVGLLRDLVTLLAENPHTVQNLQVETLNQFIDLLAKNRLIMVENFDDQTETELKNFPKRMRILFDVIGKIKEAGLETVSLMEVLYNVLGYIGLYKEMYPQNDQFPKDGIFINKNGQDIAYSQFVYQMLRNSKAFLSPTLIKNYKVILKYWFTDDQIKDIYKQWQSS